MLDFVFHDVTEEHTFGKVFFLKIFNKAVEMLKLENFKIELSLRLVSQDEIKKLNVQYRGFDKPTDVLSFSIDERISREYGILSLGDIVICPQVAKLNAAAEGISMKEEVIRLAIHGFLHLCGYDHEKSGPDRKVMLSLQEKIVNEILSSNS